MTKSQSISIKAANAAWISLGVAFLHPTISGMLIWLVLAILGFVVEHLADKD